MKKIIICIFAISIITVMAGCTNTESTANTENNAVVNTENTTEALSQEANAQASEDNTVASADVSGADIGEAAAKEIALEHAGLTEADITYVKAKLDYDNGRQVYDIEFYAGSSEYDYEIDAYTGEIYSYDYDIDNYATPSNNNSSYITLDESKVIALDKAGLTAEQVTYTQESFEYDDGVAVYQIDFISGEMEYDVEINASTGAIMEYDVESIYD